MQHRNHLTADLERSLEFEQDWLLQEQFSWLETQTSHLSFCHLNCFARTTASHWNITSSETYFHFQIWMSDSLWIFGHKNEAILRLNTTKYYLRGASEWCCLCLFLPRPWLVFNMRYLFQPASDEWSSWAELVTGKRELHSSVDCSSWRHWETGEVAWLSSRPPAHSLLAITQGLDKYFNFSRKIFYTCSAKKNFLITWYWSLR